MTQVSILEPTERKFNKQWKLMRLRKEAGYTQEEMAEILGMSLTSYNNKENGRKDFWDYEVFKISSLLDKPVEEIFLRQDSN